MADDASERNDTDVVREALRLAALGLRVLPIAPGHKYPHMKEWQDAATTDPATINDWFGGLYRGHGVGVATGRVSGVFVLDVDVSGEKCGDDTLFDLEHNYGPLPETVTAQTGSGGWHHYFAWPTTGEIRNEASNKLGPGLDIRGEGGQVLAPPTIHPNGTPYRWIEGHAPGEIAVAAAPYWLLDLLQEPKRKVLSPTPPRSVTVGANEDGPAARYNAAYTWDELLSGDGWTLDHTDRDGEQHWIRPNKDAREGTSATVGYKGGDALVVFSTSLAWLPAGAYSRFGYYACRWHNGDRSTAARALRQDERPATPPEAAPMDEMLEEQPPVDMFIDWATFWATDHTAEEWLAFPLLPAHRQTAIYAPAKTGKSLLGLDVCLAVATGRPILGGEKGDPRHVMYLDYEMTEDDLKERILDLGYTEDDDLSHFHYSLQPPISSLDSLLGGQEVLFHAQQCKAELVVVDTFGRAVQGDENDADTVRAFYRFTGMTLKRDGIALLRMDHSGKDLEKGQRGSSAKNDDVDVIWRATRSENGLTLQRTHSRVRWVPETVAIVISDDPVLAHLADSKRALYAAGTAACADDLDALDVALDASSRVAQAALKGADKGRKRKVVCDALRFRKERSGLDLMAGTTPGTTFSGLNGNQSGTTEPKVALTCDGTTWEPPGTTSESRWVVPPLSIAEPPRTSPPESADARSSDNDPDDW